MSEIVEQGVKDYRRKDRRRARILIVLILLIFVICVYSLSVSRVDISFQQALEAIWNHITGDVPVKSENYKEWWIDTVIVKDNAPRTICGICVGTILAVSGAVMQSITRNPLTDPYTIGISSAALLGMAVMVVFGVCILPSVTGVGAYIANAFVFSLIPVGVIMLVSSVKRMSSTMMILIGIAMMYMFNAFTTFIKFNAEAEQIHEIFEWSLGTLTGVSWDAVAVLIVTSIVLIIIMLVLANRINVVAAGERESIALGEDPMKVRLVCMVIVSIATAVAVCFTGSIGFVGLVAPHVARLFVGSNCKVLIPFSAIIGTMMVVGADVIVRSLPTVLPVGVVTALIGSPIFLYFLYVQRKKSVW